MKSRQIAVEAARGWLRTPFHHHGRVKGAGVDCVQLLVAVFDEAGVLPDEARFEGYAWDWHIHRSEEQYLAGLMKYCRQVESPAPGDIAMFKFGRCVSHGAIVIEWPICIHAYFRQGVVEVDAEHGAELAGRLHSFWTLFKDQS